MISPIAICKNYFINGFLFRIFSIRSINLQKISRNNQSFGYEYSIIVVLIALQPVYQNNFFLSHSTFPKFKSQDTPPIQGSPHHKTLGGKSDRASSGFTSPPSKKSKKKSTLLEVSSFTIYIHRNNLMHYRKQ